MMGRVSVWWGGAPECLTAQQACAPGPVAVLPLVSFLTGHGKPALKQGPS